MIDKDTIKLINIICDRLKNVINQYDVLDWLTNFDEADIEKALLVLNCFEYYSTEDIINEFDDQLSTIIKKSKSKNVYLFPVGKSGKSGHAMMYYLKKSESFKTLKTIFIVSNDTLLQEKDNNIVSTKEIQDNSIIVLVDDFAGSGNTIRDFYNKIVSNIPKRHKALALTVAYMTQAKKTLDIYNINIFGNHRIPAFTYRGSIFGYPTKMKRIRDFCFKYGNKIHPLKNYNNGKTQFHPFGFSNSQTLIGFAHSIPNNTLPIIWADKFIKEDNKSWIPLFPRNTKHMIERTKKFKQEQKYWIGIAYRLGFDKMLLGKNSKSIRLLSVIYLKNKQKNATYICQSLGINLTEYDNIIKEGLTKKLFLNDESLTENAIFILKQIRKKIKFEETYSDRNALNKIFKMEEDYVYVPKTFRGNS